MKHFAKLGIARKTSGCNYGRIYAYDKYLEILNEGTEPVGFLEQKAPGKSADPRKFKTPHDKAQWEKLHSLPILIYADGNGCSLFQDGELVDSEVPLVGDIESSGHQLQAPPRLLSLFEKLFRREPIPPHNAKDLPRVTSGLCRLLHDKVTEQLALISEAHTSLAVDRRNLPNPEPTTKPSPTASPKP